MRIFVRVLDIVRFFFHYSAIFSNSPSAVSKSIPDFIPNYYLIAN